MSPVEWGVQVDSSGPVVLSSQPVLGAGDQPLNTTVTLHFNEPLAPASVNASTIRLFDALGNTVPASVSMPDSSSVLVTPVQPLARAGRYFVQLTQGVADLQGNFVLESAFVADFFTVQGNLSAPAKLAGATGRGLAKGDFNGDGRVDLLTIADGVAPDVSSFNIFLQNASGGFDAPLRRDTPARSDCVDTAGFVQAGDIDGDGRVDIISTRGTCGVEVAYQGSDGQFSRTDLLGAAGAFALADLDGDGRLDVVGSAFAGEQVSLWRQQADGSWIAEQVPLFTNGFGTLAVGDLNGDGRPDLVLTSGQGDLTRTLGVSYQQPDGSFAVPQYRSDGVFNRAATIGDLDGDGRLDLLLATPDVQGLRWFRQQADGSLAEPVVIAGFGDAEQLQVADLDGDGRADIVFGLNGFAPFVVVHWQGVGGSFSAPQNFRAGLPPVSLSLVVADLNGDGRLDVGLTGPVLLLNNGSPVTPASAGQAAANAAVTVSRKTQGWRQAIQQIKPLRLTR
ncbi:MAG: VCBS repeat-containing protein [Burkholderiales bacterium]|nr:VCBS repeat-containing protein [Burkholderiales bacterium]